MYYEIKWEETPFLARPWRGFFLLSLVGFWVCLTVCHLLYVWSWRCGGDRWAALGLPVLGPQPSDSSRWTPFPIPCLLRSPHAPSQAVSSPWACVPAGTHAAAAGQALPARWHTAGEQPGPTAPRQAPRHHTEHRVLAPSTACCLKRWLLAPGAFPDVRMPGTPLQPLAAPVET